MKRIPYLGMMIAILTIAATGFQIVEDPDFLKQLSARLSEYHVRYPEEKVYVHFDKPFYKPGDDIWFNVFAVNSNTNKPTTVSDVVYVELIDPKGNVSVRRELVLKEGTAHGDFALEDDLAGGMYTVRAFTQWMKNFGEERMFKKTLQVQRIITPRLLLKLDFEKESYGPGDAVKAKLTVTDLKNEKVSAAHVIVTIKIKGTAVSEFAVFTNTNGIADITFRLPEPLTTTDGLLQAIISTDGDKESISRSIPIVLNKIALAFFPEGGHWVENVKTKMAFKALNEFAKGADISGVIVDESGNEVAAMESFHMGMGAFELEPARGKKYFARINRPAGNEALIPLPEALPRGYSLQLGERTRKDTVSMIVHAPAASSAYVVGRSGGEMYFAEKVMVSKGKNVVCIPTEKFPAGIAVFTLFDGNGTEYCERLVFLNSERVLSIAMTTDKQQYLPREKVSVKIKTTDQEGKPVRAKLSLAVADDQLISFADDKQDNILSSLLLSSEVSGEVQEPSYYFDPNETDAPQALDYLLMTQGWRRFSWKEVKTPQRVIVHRREKVNVLGGRLVNDKGEGISSDVALIELASKRRIESVRTTADGHFVFRNIDPTTPILLMAKLPGKIIITQDNTFSVSLNDLEGTVLRPEIVGIKGVGKFISPTQNVALDEEVGMDMALTQDVQQLSEVVVSGFGIQEKRELTGSVTTVYESQQLNSVTSVENALQGRVAGVMIVQQSASPGASQTIAIRGSSSLGAGRGEPLYIVDGSPIGTSLNQNFSNGSIVGPEDIATIEVMASPEASALFGSAAANGVILITTRSRIGYTYFPTKQRKPKYTSLTVNPRRFSATREFYTPPAPKKSAKREDFRTTAYWNHTIVTGDNGEATVSFNNTDAVSAFRITAEGITGTGLVGRKETVFSTQLPLSLDAKLPEFLGFEDVLKLPVVIRNETSAAKTARINVSLPDGLMLKEATEADVRVAPRSAETLWFTISPKGIEGDFPIAIGLASPDYQDEIRHTLHVQPVGFPVRLSFSAQQKEKSIQFSIQDAEKGTVKATLTAFPDVLSDLLAGAEGIFREPHGCFEQTSSSTFPNVLALQFLQQTNAANKKTEELALSYIKAGYKRLISYEVKGGGFDWFGHPPAHEALTAYGLIEFYEMKKVYPDVDDKMIERTRKWLLSRRKGDGTFELQQHALHDFSRPSGDVSNVYITYALSETGTTDLEKEYQHNLGIALQSRDMYRLALMANIAFNLKKEKDYEMLVDYFEKQVGDGPMNTLVASHSFVRGTGVSLTNEVVALWAVALMKSPHPDMVRVSECIKHIAASRSFGMFGSTQSTVLCLKALTEYAKLVRAAREGGSIELLVNNKSVEKATFAKDTRDAIVMRDWKAALTNGDQAVRVSFSGETLPYAVDIQWYTKKPQSTAGCEVGLSTSLQKRQIRVNETVRFTAKLSNKTTKGLPMTMMVLGIPAGLSAQPWQLKEMQEKKVFDFYEITGGQLILYYRQMMPSETRTVNLDLKAEIPGTYTGSASSAYLYYTNEYRDWVKGEEVMIDE